MPKTDPVPDIKARLDSELAKLRAHAATTTNACTVAKLIALSDERVPALLLRKIDEGDQFRGIRCIARGAVLVDLECPVGTICLVSPSFLVHVDLERRIVVGISDPFDPTEVVPAAGSLKAMSSGIGTSDRTVTVTVKGVADRDLDIDGISLSFNQDDEASVKLLPGTRTCHWAVSGEPGTAFSVNVAATPKPVSFSTHVGTSGTERGEFTFTVS